MRAQSLPAATRLGLAVSGACLVAACGTRLPNAAFNTVQVSPGAQVPGGAQGGGPGGPAGSPGASGGTSAGPSAGASGGPGAGPSAGPGVSGGGGLTGPPNTASDVGVTATSVRVGLIVSKTSPLGQDAFSPSLYGATAYIKELNAHGGAHGRTVDLRVCDDGGSGQGNQDCVHQLIDKDHVFALVGSTSLTYAGAPYVNAAGVPDIGGQPIGNDYDTYRHLWGIYGDAYPRDGTVGYHGMLTGGTEDYHYFATHLGAKVAGVVYYDQSDSTRFAQATAKGLKLEGYTVVMEPVNFAFPNWDAAVVDMKAKHVDAVWDVLEDTGNQSLCKSMDDNGLNVLAKVQTIESWRSTIAAYHAPCRNTIYATAQNANYDDLSNPQVAAFRRALVETGLDGQTAAHSMWALEGWGAAQLMVDAMTPCGATLTRACVENYLGTVDAYTGHGLFLARNWKSVPPPPNPMPPGFSAPACVSVGRWSDAANGGHGGWLTVAYNVCTNAQQFWYSA